MTRSRSSPGGGVLLGGYPADSQAIFLLKLRVLVVDFDPLIGLRCDSLKCYKIRIRRLCSQPIKIVSPALHHDLARAQVGGAVIGSSIGVADGMRQLVFNVVDSVV